MLKSKLVIDQLSKLFEHSLISYKDLASEIVNILKSKRDEIIFKMKISSKEEVEILNKRIENLDKRIRSLEKTKTKAKAKTQVKKTKQVK